MSMDAGRHHTALLASRAAEILGRIDAGFEPRIGYTSDDMVVMQALVVAGLGVTTSPGPALRAHRVKGIVASELPESSQHTYAATYGEPPDPPATTALLAALAEVAASIGDVSPTPDASPDAESECPIVLPVLEGTSMACPISC